MFGRRMCVLALAGALAVAVVPGGASAHERDVENYVGSGAVGFCDRGLVSADLCLSGADFDVTDRAGALTTITIEDDIVNPVAGGYQIYDGVPGGGGTLLATAQSWCGSTTFRMPPGAFYMNVYVNPFLLGAVTCAPDSGPGTTGLIIVDYR